MVYLWAIKSQGTEQYAIVTSFLNKSLFLLLFFKQSFDGISDSGFSSSP